MTEQRPAATEHGVAVVGGPARGASRTAKGGGPGAGDTEPDGPAEEMPDESVDLTPAPTRAQRLRSRTVVPRRTGPGRGADTPGWVVPVLAAATVVSVIAAIVFGVKWSDLSAQNDSRATVQRVARDFLTALTNFNAKTVDGDFRTISTYATGDFAKQSNQFFGTTIRQQLEQAQAWSKGQFRYLYVQSLDGDQAQVYAEVDQTYANNKVTQPIPDVLQVVLGMTQVNGTWKISAVTVLQPPSSPSSPTGSAGSAVGK